VGTLVFFDTSEIEDFLCIDMLFKTFSKRPLKLYSCQIGLPFPVSLNMVLILPLKFSPSMSKNVSIWAYFISKTEKRKPQRTFRLAGAFMFQVYILRGKSQHPVDSGFISLNLADKHTHPDPVSQFEHRPRCDPITCIAFCVIVRTTMRWR